MTAGREFRSHDSINDPYLWGLLEHATSIFSRARELELAQYGISMEQMSVLHSLLINDGSATLDEIATIIVRQYNSVSTIVNRMAGAGLVRKERVDHEKKYRIVITDKARTIADTVPRKSIQMMLSKLDSKDKEQLATFLEQIIRTGRDLIGLSFKPPFLSDEP